MKKMKVFGGYKLNRQMEMYEEGYFNYRDLKDLVENGLKDKPRRKEDGK